VASERRDRQREALILAAEARIAAKGLAALKARDLAADIGVALGAIYNLVKDLDDLVLLVSARTLARLYTALSEATRDLPPVRSREDAADRLVAIALAYRGFAKADFNLWRTLFEHRPATERTLSDWAATEQWQILQHFVRPLILVMPHSGVKARERMGLTLFGAVHGIVVLAYDGKIVGVPEAQVDGQMESLVRLVVAGMAPADAAATRLSPY
jgi:AcrR family transcriptional regulator